MMMSMSLLADADLLELSEIDPTIKQSPRYATNENFTGKKVDGYNVKKIVIKRKAALKLKQVQEYFQKYGYTLVIYDAYRPKRAVKNFVRWSKNKDISTKKRYYPTLDKSVLFEKGYICETSSHCKGYTADLTIMQLGKPLQEVNIKERTLKNKEKISFLDDGTVDMGTSFDCFHEASHHNSDLVNEVAQKNRKFLEDTMHKFGFTTIKEEWWHYTLKDTDSSEDYDIPIE